MEWGVSAHIPGSTFHAASPVTSLLKRRDGPGGLNPAEPIAVFCFITFE